MNTGISVPLSLCKTNSNNLTFSAQFSLKDVPTGRCPVATGILGLFAAAGRAASPRCYLGEIKSHITAARTDIPAARRRAFSQPK